MEKEITLLTEMKKIEINLGLKEFSNIFYLDEDDLTFTNKVEQKINITIAYQSAEKY